MERAGREPRTPPGRRRRGRGEGSITRLADGRWQARMSWTDSSGRRHRKAVYGRTRQEAQQKLRAVLAARDAGLPVVEGRRTVGDLLSYWLETVAPATLRPRTLAEYRRLARDYITPYLDRTRLSRLGPADVQRWLASLTAAGAGPRTVQLAHSVLRRALTLAVKWEWVGRNVAALVTPPRVPRNEERTTPFTLDEVRTVLFAARGERLEALYVLAVTLGLRRGELLALHWSDIDLDAGLVRIARQLQRVDGRLSFAEPKAARSRRTLPLPPELLAVLAAHRRRQLAERLAAGPLWQDHGLVFPSERGTPLEPRNLVRAYHTLLARAGLPRRPFHALRHTCASLLLASGVDLRVVQQVLGHSSIGVTGDIYTHVRPATVRQAAGTVLSALGLPAWPPALGPAAGAGAQAGAEASAEAGTEASAGPPPG